MVNITGAGELGPIDGSSQSDYGEVNVYNFTGSGLSIWQNIKLTATNSNIYAVTNLRNTFNVENCIIEEKFTTYYLTREITGSCVLKDVTINNADGGTTLYITNCEDVTIDNCTNDNGTTSLIETDTTIIGGSHNNVEVQNNANVSISEATVGELRLTNDTATATVTSGTVDTITAGDSVTVENLIISGGTFGTTSIDRDTAEDIPLTYKETGTDNQYYILTDNTSTADLDGYKQSTGDNTYSQMYTFEEDLTSSNTVGFNITSTQDGERERNVTFGTANIEGITKLGLIVTGIPNGVTVKVDLAQ